MKRVLFIVNKLKMGGLEKVNSTIAASLSDEYHVTLYSQKRPDKDYVLDEKLNKVDILQGSISRLFFLRKPNLLLKSLFDGKISSKKNLVLSKILKEIDFSCFDSVVLNSEDIFFSEMIKKKNPNINIIWWVHNEYEVIINKYLGDSIKELNDCLNFVDTVITLTDRDRKAFSILHSNVVKISNPITILTGNDLSNVEDKVISFTSRLIIEQKGLDLLIEIVEKVDPEWKFSIAGDGPDKKKFYQMIKEKDILDRFVLRGELKEKELIEHYKNSSIFISTSRWEGFGLVIVEAMSFGLPIISFDNNGPYEILLQQNEEFGKLISKYDIEEFSKTINKFAQSKSLRQKYSDKSLKRVEEYSIPKILEKWMEIL